jgi:hypothetical protein
LLVGDAVLAENRAESPELVDEIGRGIHQVSKKDG